jgi:hypothetical protein
MNRAAVHRIAARSRAEWGDSMHFGTEITVDREAQRHKGWIQDQILARLLKGPALETEFSHASRSLSTIISYLNKRVLPMSGRRIVGEDVEIITRLGLRVKVRRYELIREGA